MSTRQEVSDEKQKQLEMYQRRLDELTQKYKGPVLTLQTQSAQVIPNAIDQLVHQVVELESRIYKLTNENQKINGELAVLKATSPKKDDKNPQPKPIKK